MTPSTAPGLRVGIKPAVYDLTFDQFQRYHAVARILEELAEGERLRVLDVGGHPGVLADVVEGADVTVADARPSGRGSVVAHGARLPFGPQSIDVVVSSDSLEHLPAPERSNFVAELARVARRAVILGAPFHHPSVVAAEMVVSELIRNLRGGAHGYLAEHLEHGLPDRSEVERALEGFGMKVASLPNGHLPRWVAMMAITAFLESDPRYVQLRGVANRLYNTTYGDREALEPSYRHILVGRCDGGDPEAILQPLRGSGGGPSLEPGFVLALLAELVHHAGPGDAPRDGELLLRQVGHLARLLRARDTDLERKDEQLDEERAAYRQLEEGYRKIEAHQQEVEAARHEAEIQLGVVREHLAGVSADHDAVKAEYAKLESYVKHVEEVVKEQTGLVEERSVLAARVEELEREVGASRERIEALRQHAENLTEAVERLQSSLANRMIRRLRGGG